MTGPYERPRDLIGWRRTEREEIYSHKILGLSRYTLDRPSNGEGKEQRDAVILECPDWVNVVAMTERKEVVFVRQFRYGTQSFTLEIPGGMVETGEAPAEAAARELLEETGYQPQTPLERLGVVDPNPALQGNECSMWLAEPVHFIEEPRGDGEEEIEVELVPVAKLEELIRHGVIRHSLVLCALQFYFLATR